MADSTADLAATVAGWKKLRTLRALQIDLERAQLIRDCALDRLRDLEAVTALVQKLGLNDEGLDEYPTELHPDCGHGLRIWQYPTQFAKYLVDLASLRVTSYLELGVRHGGSFVATVEYLQRFRPLQFAIGVDVLTCPSLLSYSDVNPVARFERMNTQGDEFRDLLASHASLDLVFIDSFHDELQRRREIDLVVERARFIALHDIAHDELPGLRRLWDELKATGRFECREYCDQYPSLGRSYMGIGLAIRREGNV